MDFTVKRYKELINAISNKNYSFQTLNDFIVNSIPLKSIVLRHDVDKFPSNSLKFAKIEAELGIKGSYYFRMVPESWNENIICEINSLGPINLYLPCLPQVIYYNPYI